MTAARHPILLSAEDLRFEPDDGLRRELYDGVMHVVPPASDNHSWEVRVVDRALSQGAPDDVYLLQNVGVHVGLRRLFVPDLTVVERGTAYHDYGYDPGGVLLVVEVVSPSSVTHDRVTKHAVYAEQGIPYFWRIDDGPRLDVFRLDRATESYLRVGAFGPGEKGTITEPWSVEIDMTEFVLPHKR